MTIGTSIICGSFLEESSLLFFTFTCHTPPRHSSSLSWRGFESVRQSCWLSGLVIQKIEGLFAADSVPDSIEAPILCQTSADRFRSLFRLMCQRFEFVIQLVLAHLNLLQLRNAFQ